VSRLLRNRAEPSRNVIECFAQDPLLVKNISKGIIEGLQACGGSASKQVAFPFDYAQERFDLVLITTDRIHARAPSLERTNAPW
jgi:hypothetical protein